MNFIVETFKEFANFIKKTNAQPNEIQSAKQKIKKLFSLLIIDFLFAVILLFIISLIGNFGFIDSREHSVNSMLRNVPTVAVILLSVIILPFFEELIFRLPLKFKYNYFAHFIILLTSLAGKNKKIEVKNRLQNFCTNNFRGIFFLSTILFAILHLTNYKISLTVILFSPILIASQFFAGLCFGYLRVKFNFILGFLMHAIHNAVFVGISLISMNATVEKLNIENEKYSIKIEEVSPMNDESFYSNHSDSLKFQATNLRKIITNLFEKDEYLYKTNDSQMLETRINLDFIDKTNEISECHNEIIEKNQEIILQHLSNLYNFEVKTQKIEQEVWNLRVKDSLKLIKYRLNASDSSSTVTKSLNKIEIKSAKLQEIAKILSSNYDKIIIYVRDLRDENLINSTSEFDLTIPRKDFQSLKNLLNSQYGLELQNSKQELEYIYVKFDD